MGGMITVECRCGAVFVSFDGADLCPDCNAARDPLVCVECGCEMREAVPSGLCGLCDESWVPRSSVYAAALAAMAGDRA